MIPPAILALIDVEKMWPDKADHFSRVLVRDGVEIGSIEIGGSDDLLALRSLQISSEHQNSGNGTWAMSEVCRLADLHGARVYLDAHHRPDEPDGGWLPRFYRKFGFETHSVDPDDNMGEMERTPTPPEPEGSPEP